MFIFGGVYDDTIEVLDMEERKNGWRLIALKKKCEEWKGFICVAACALNEQEILIFGDVIGEHRNFIV